MTSDLDEAIRLLRATERPTTNESEYQLWRTARERLLARHPEPPKLLPCPFCGGEADTANFASGSVIVACRRPGPSGGRPCTASTAPYGTEAAAIAAWNRRTP